MLFFQFCNHNSLIYPILFFHEFTPFLGILVATFLLGDSLSFIPYKNFRIYFFQKWKNQFVNLPNPKI